MSNADIGFAQIILLVGAVIVFNIFIKSCANRTGLPGLVGYMLLGFGLKVANNRLGFMGQEAREIFSFLAEVGIITLLFRIGLESNLHGLVKQLRRASPIWVGNVLVSGAAGYAASRYLLGLGTLPSLFAGVALTATSVAISVGIWHEAHALDSRNGELLVDIAELDDLSSIILMTVLFACVTAMQDASTANLAGTVLESIGVIVLKLVMFGTFCLGASIVTERYILKFFKNVSAFTESMLIVAGMGFIIAACAGILGFSLAIGAFFAGLVFSRDKNAVKIDASFDAIYALFSPFFFIGIGLQIAPDSLTAAGGIGAVLLVAAVLGKIAGVMIPALLTTGLSGSVLLGVSMVPRAEIAMVVMQNGFARGAWAVPQRLFSAMVMVSALTCLLSPFAVRYFLRRWPDMARGGKS